MAAALEMAITTGRRRRAAEMLPLADELLGELSEVYEQLGRPEDVLTVMGEAIDAGYRGQPGPRCRLAELYLRIGVSEAATGFMRRCMTDTPRDVCGCTTTPDWNTPTPATRTVPWSGSPRPGTGHGDR